jgi:hypothetical protein
LDKAIINLGEVDFTPGLSFVAMSRVKKLSGLLFKTPFPIGHLKKPQGSSGDLDADTEHHRHLSLGPLSDIDLTVCTEPPYSRINWIEHEQISE